MSIRQKAMLAGGLAGFVNGFLGAGAGLFLVPIYAAWLKLPRRRALATSVATVAPLCALSAAFYYARGQLPMQTAWPYLLGGLCGGLAGGALFERIPVKWLSRALAAFMIYGGLHMLGLIKRGS
ncbi:MAG: sulfite exporter TauE/SafE family protein [Oscillospiraceae bacterium]|nr:sulfite exporter TauE/SafE family protein [Oscillospiraceae bacterium]